MSRKNNTVAKTQSTLVAPVQAVETHQPSAMDFAVQQLSVNQVEVENVAPAQMFTKEQFDAALQTALENRVPVTKKAKSPRAPRAKRVEQNGVKRPLAGNGICAQLWVEMDSITAIQGSACTVQQIKAAFPTFNQVNIQCEYATWKKFNGVTGRIVSPTTTEVINC